MNYKTLKSEVLVTKADVRQLQNTVQKILSRVQVEKLPRYAGYLPAICTAHSRQPIDVHLGKGTISIRFTQHT